MSVTAPTAIGLGRSAAVTENVRPSRGATSRILVIGNLAWLGWLWASILVLLPIALLVSAAVDSGDMTESLWAGAGIGWQRWILFTAGIVLARTFLREFVTRGVTRRRFAESAVIAIATLSAICGAVAVAGYLIEWPIFHWQDWPLDLAPGNRFGAGRIPRLFVEYTLLGAVHLLSGWLVGSAFVRYRWVGATLLIPACLVPVALVELVASQNTRNFRTDALPDALDHPSMLLTLGVALPVVAAAAYVASRVTRALPLR